MATCKIQSLKLQSSPETQAIVVGGKKGHCGTQFTTHAALPNIQRPFFLPEVAARQKGLPDPMQRLVVPEVMARLRVLRVLLLPMVQEEMVETVAEAAALAEPDMLGLKETIAASAYLQVKMEEVAVLVVLALLEAKAQTDVQSCTSENHTFYRTEPSWIRLLAFFWTAPAV